jgi:hypothetical protein
MLENMSAFAPKKGPTESRDAQLIREQVKLVREFVGAPERNRKHPDKIYHAWKRSAEAMKSPPPPKRTKHSRSA